MGVYYYYKVVLNFKDCGSLLLLRSDAIVSGGLWHLPVKQCFCLLLSVSDMNIQSYAIVASLLLYAILWAD